MSRRDVDAVIAGSNPVETGAVERLPLAETERELLAAIITDPAEHPSCGSFSSPGAHKEPRNGEGLLGRALLPRRRPLALGAAIAALAAAVLIVGGAGGGPAAGPDAALGEDVAELLKASPPILIDAPGWRVDKLNEPFESSGITNFERSSATPNGSEDMFGFAELQWRLEPLRKLIQAQRSLPRVMRRAYRRQSIEPPPYRQRETTAPVLGTTARVFSHLEPGDPPVLVGAAVWEHRGQAFQFRSFTADLAGFKRRLASLREVGYRAWRDALPPRIERRGRGIFATNQHKGEGR